MVIGTIRPHKRCMYVLMSTLARYSSLARNTQVYTMCVASFPSSLVTMPAFLICCYCKQQKGGQGPGI